MPETRPSIVTVDHEQRAFEMLRRPDWPATLKELRAAARQAALVDGLAHRLANGQGMDPAGEPATSAPVPLRTSDWPPRRGGVRAAGLTERRRRDDAVDLKKRAAGDSDE